MNETDRNYHGATAKASPNIALIKYWGNRDHAQRIPANGSLSITLGELSTTTTVRPDPELTRDQLIINQSSATSVAQERAGELLSQIRLMAGSNLMADVESQNDFPMGAGIASSASAFAALALAGCKAYGLALDSAAMSRLARKASGSAARSICAGFVELHSAAEEQQAYAETIFPADHWDLFDLIAVVDTGHKAVSSSEGHALADTSPIQAARVADAPRRLRECKQAIELKDFNQLATVVELDSNLMHAVMMSSKPPILYWLPETLALMRGVERLRAEGWEVCYTIDAGPNVHCICTGASLRRVRAYLEAQEFLVQIIQSGPGSGARLL